MSGETEKQVSGWTVDTLKEYVEALRSDDQKAVQAALLAAKEAVIKAETATEKRFESVNEFRQQLGDQSNTFLPRPEYNAQHKALEDRVTDLTDRMNKTDGAKSGSDITVGKIYAAVGVVGAILAILVLLSNGVFE